MDRAREPPFNAKLPSRSNGPEWAVSRVAFPGPGADGRNGFQWLAIHDSRRLIRLALDSFA
jgi:hypothetical protein